MRFSLALAFPGLGIRLMLPGEKMPRGFDMLRWEFGPTAEEADAAVPKRGGAAPAPKPRRKVRH